MLWFGARILLGLLFIFSAAAKLFPIEFFDLTLGEFSFLPLWSIPILSRLLIGIEFFLGLQLLLLPSGNKLWYVLTGIVLMLFNAILLYQWLGMGKSDNCGCFGELISFSPGESLFKNLVMLLILAFLYLKPSKLVFPIKWVWMTILPLALAAPFVVEPFPFQKWSDAPQNQPFDYNAIWSFTDEQRTKYKEEVLVIPVLSASCMHCKNVAKQLQVIQNRGSKNNVHTFILGTDVKVKEFLNETAYTHTWSKEENIEYILPLLEGRFPTILKIKDGIVVDKWIGSSINYLEFERILNE
jgi:hypothetical protein